MAGSHPAGARAAHFAAASLALLLATGAARAASITAEVDRTEATIEDRLVLTVTVTGTQQARPELPELAAFEVVPAGQSKQWNFVNGRSSSSVSYRYLLLPRAEGEFRIGPATAEVDGQRVASQPFSVRIVAAGQASGQQRDLFLTTELSTTRPWVGQQVLFTWRLYRRVQIADARLDPFEFDGFLVEDLGEVREFETRINGQRFLVSEIRKALFPQETGPLVIPATRLTCEMLVRDSRRPSGLMGDFFGRSTETKVLRSAPIDVEVRALPDPPAGFTGLVGKFELTGTVGQSELRVGESVTLTLEVAGRGNVQMIPEPRLPELDTVKIYDDKPGARVERQASGLSGSRTFRKALVPRVAGELVLPPVRLVYFDPEAADYRTAASGPIALNVLPAEGPEELGLTESLAPTAGKVAVRILADDILPLHAGLDGLEGPRRPGPFALTALLAAPPLLYLGAVVLASRRRRYREDAGLERRRRALKRARGRLRRLAGRDPAAAAPALSRCLREFLGDKLDLEGGALTAAEARRCLAERGLPEEQVAEVGRLLERLEAVHYGDAGYDPELGERIGALLPRLDRAL